MAKDEWLDLGDLVERAHDLIDVGLLDEAQDLLDSYAPMYQGNWELHFLYSRIEAESGNHQAAIDCLRQSLRLGGHNADTYLGFFYAHTELGRMDKGARYLFRARSRFPRNEQVISALIWYYGETNRFRDALGTFRRARTEPIDNPDVYRNAGLVYQRVGEFVNAEQCYREALARAPLSEEVLDLLADLYMTTGENPKAVELYKQFLEKSTNNIHALSRLVFALGQEGDVEEAEKVARQTIALYPNSPVGYVDLAYVHLNEGDPDDALSEVERALLVAPLEAEAYRVKAIVLSEKDSNELAAEAFATALSLEPDNAEIMRDFYHHLRKVGDYARMEQVVQDVIKMEKPYCIEDYWFLADHYWDEGKPVRAFRCLNQAHKSMPGERELLPPIITIMLDRGHESYAMPHLLGYATRAGWDQTMATFARHRRLQTPMSRESVRFLRFYAESYEDFRSHAFRHYLSKWVLVAAIVAAVPVCLVFAAAGNTTATLIAAAACLGCAGLARLANYLVEGPPMMLLKTIRGLPPLKPQ